MIEFREARDEDAQAITEIWNQTFPPVTVARYRAQTDHTAAVAVEDGRLIGAIPFQIRPLLVAPGVTVRAAFAHSVSSAPGRRGAGIGSGMMAGARTFLPGHCEVMCVYTDGEGEAPYTFYQRTGHIDMHYAYRWSGESATAEDDPSVSERPESAIDILEPRLFQIFHGSYGAYAGYWPREPGFYRQALGSVFYVQIPYVVSLLTIGDRAAPDGYAIVGRRDDDLTVLEFATLEADPGVADRMLRHITALARREQRMPRLAASPLHPFAATIRQLGWRTPGRRGTSTILAARALRPDVLAARLWRPHRALEDVDVWAWAPGAEQIALHRAVGKARAVVTLEMKGEYLHRLVLGRLDLASALAQELVTAHGDAEPTAALTHALPWHPWLYHAIEFI